MSFNVTGPTSYGRVYVRPRPLTGSYNANPYPTPPRGVRGPRLRPVVGYRSLGYSNSRSSSGRKKSSYGRSYSFKSRVRAVEPAKHLRINDDDFIKIALAHNTVYSYNVTAKLVQGIAEYQRRGDGAFLEALKYNIHLVTNEYARGYCYRVMCFWSGEELSDVTPPGLSALFSAGQIFLNGTGANVQLDAIVNPKAVTVIFDETVTINSLVSNVKDVYQMQGTISLKNQMNYQADGSIYGKNRNLYMTVIPFNIGGTGNGTTTGPVDCGEVYGSLDLIFKDI